VPQSNAAARSRNSQQYTQRLSIQNEDGSRITGRFPSSAKIKNVLRLCHWPITDTQRQKCVSKPSNGKITQKLGLTFDLGRILIGVEGSELPLFRTPCPPHFSNEGNRGAQGQFCLSRPFFVGQSILTTWSDFVGLHRVGLCGFASRKNFV
jgi:hypothetical protein